MRSNVAIVIRQMAERTTAACLELLKEQAPARNIIVIGEKPFSSAVRRTFELGIESKQEWTLAVDADILVTPECIDELLQVAERLEDYFFGVQGKVLDKLYGVPRGGGPHLYRTKYLEKALAFIPREGTSLRPESDTYDAMAAIGLHYYFGQEVYGLHDYEQSYCDLYRKGFLHAKKHWRYLAHFAKHWQAGSTADKDFSLALLGLRAALEHTQPVLIDRDYFPSEVTDLLFSVGLAEKKEMSPPAAGYVRKTLAEYDESSSLKWFEAQNFDYIKRSDEL